MKKVTDSDGGDGLDGGDFGPTSKWWKCKMDDRLITIQGKLPCQLHAFYIVPKPNKSSL